MGAEDGSSAVLFSEVCHVPLVLLGRVGLAVFAGFLVDGEAVIEVVFAGLLADGVLVFGVVFAGFWLMVSRFFRRYAAR